MVKQFFANFFSYILISAFIRVYIIKYFIIRVILEITLLNKLFYK